VPKPRLALLIVVLAAACGPKGLQARLINSEKRAGAADNALDEAEKAMKALEPDDAERALNEAKEALADPDIEYYPEREMIRDRLKRDEEFLPRVRAERERRDLELKVAERRKKIDEVFAEYRPAMAAMRKAGAEKDQVSKAVSLADDVEEELDDGKELEPKDAAYAAYAADLRKQLEHDAPERKLARARVEFVDAVGELRHDAMEKAKVARSEKKREARAEAWGEAREKYAGCAEKGQKRLAETPELVRAAILLEGARTTPEAVVAFCATQVDAVTRLLKAFKPVVAKKAPPPPKKKKK
jgi:hypothetical protein